LLTCPGHVSNDCVPLHPLLNNYSENWYQGCATTLIPDLRSPMLF
jgi:hypothetical protein